jgi:hypothetical protein
VLSERAESTATWPIINNTTYAVVQLVEALCYKPEGRGFDINFPAALWPLCRLSLWQKMSTGNISSVKAAGAYVWQPYHLRVPIVWKCGSLNHLEHSGPVQAYIGIALPYFYLYFKLRFVYRLYRNTRFVIVRRLTSSHWRWWTFKSFFVT